MFQFRGGYDLFHALKIFCLYLKPDYLPTAPSAEEFECGSRIIGAKFLIVFHSIYRSVLLSFEIWPRDGQRTDGRADDSYHSISGSWGGAANSNNGRLYGARFLIVLRLHIGDVMLEVARLCLGRVRWKKKTTCRQSDRVNRWRSQTVDSSLDQATITRKLRYVSLAVRPNDVWDVSFDNKRSAHSITSVDLMPRA